MLQLSSLQHEVCLLGLCCASNTGQEERDGRQFRIDTNSGPDDRVPGRRGGTWPKHLDAAAQHGGIVSRGTVAGTAIRHGRLREPVFKAVPVLGVRRGLPGVHCEG
jgi:hypothetical protein